MHTRRAVFFLAAIILAAGAGLTVPFLAHHDGDIPASSAAAPDASPMKTVIVRYGVATSSFPTKVVDGSCWTYSVAAPYRGDVWRCATASAVYDPCFGTERHGRVVCGVDPVNGDEGFQLNLTSPLPPPKLPGNMPQTNWGWLVELRDGAYCTPFTGAALPSIQGQTAFYGCADAAVGERIVLLGALNDDKPVWTAQKAVAMQSGSGWNITSLATIPVKEVWQ